MKNILLFFMRSWYQYYRTGRYPPSAHTQACYSMLTLLLVPYIVLHEILAKKIEFFNDMQSKPIEYALAGIFALTGFLIVRSIFPEALVSQVELPDKRALRGRILFVVICTTLLILYLHYSTIT
jgi:hypothetical protein